MNTLAAVVFDALPVQSDEFEHPRDGRNVRRKELRSWLLREAAGMSLPEIAAATGTSAHSGVLRRVRMVDAKREADAAYRLATDTLLDAVREIARLHGRREP